MLRWLVLLVAVVTVLGVVCTQVRLPPGDVVLSGEALPPGTVEFHILADESDLSADDYRRAVEACAADGPEQAVLDGFGWFAVNTQSVAVKPMRCIHAEWQGRSYVLAKTDLASSLDARTPWKVHSFKLELPHGYAGEIVFEIDEAGGEQMERITGANRERLLGIFLFGEMHSSATIKGTISAHGIITGYPESMTALFRRLKDAAR